MNQRNGSTIENLNEVTNGEPGRIYLMERTSPRVIFSLVASEVAFSEWEEGNETSTHQASEVVGGPGYFDIKRLSTGRLYHPMVGIFIPDGVDQGAVLEHLRIRFENSVKLVGGRKQTSRRETVFFFATLAFLVGLLLSSNADFLRQHIQNLFK